MNVFGMLNTNAQLLDDADPGPHWIRMKGERPSMDHIAQGDGSWALPTNKALHAEALAVLNSVYQADIDALNRAYSVAAMAGGSTQATKQAAITTQFNTRKTKYLADLNELRTQYGA